VDNVAARRKFSGRSRGSKNAGEKLKRERRGQRAKLGKEHERESTLTQAEGGGEQSGAGGIGKKKVPGEGSMGKKEWSGEVGLLSERILGG